MFYATVHSGGLAVILWFFALIVFDVRNFFKSIHEAFNIVDTMAHSQSEPHILTSTINNNVKIAQSCHQIERMLRRMRGKRQCE